MPEPGPATLTLETCTSIDDIPARPWERLAGHSNPFLRYEFFQALEASGCTSEATGWSPSHLVFKSDDKIVGLAPAFLKSHSMGEYVFDWAWADAYQRHGLSYYPKLLIAIPFTPSAGPRLLLDPDLRQQLTAEQIHDLLDTLTDTLGAHSWHLLFPDSEDQKLLHHDRELHRIGCQFHWHNHGYEDFDDFLSALASRKRKSIRKERKKVADIGLDIRTLSGSELEERHWDAFFQFYMSTTDKKWGQSYLHREFFSMLGDRMPDSVVMVMAFDGERPVAGALNLKGADCLYGRNWGALESHKFLHFECCYYRAIDYAIEHGLARVEAGAQGPHKVQRGYLPAPVYSLHYIRDPGFEDAVGDFVMRERFQIEREMAAITEEYSPYRNEDGDG